MSDVSHYVEGDSPGTSMPEAPKTKGENDSDFERVHSQWMNIRTGASLGVPLVGFLSIAAISQVYAVVYKVPVDSILYVGIAMTFWNIVNNFVAGTLQDKETLHWLFPKEKFGRRAPWIITTTPVGMAIVFVLWYPPSVDPDFLLIWFTVAVFFINFVISTLLIAGNAGVAELYPFKEERLRIDLWALMWSLFVGFFLLVAAAFVFFEAETDDEDLVGVCNGSQAAKDEVNREVSNRAKEVSLFPAIVLGAIMGLNLVSAKPLSEAKQAVENKIGNPLKEVKELLKESAYFRYSVFQVVDGFETIIDLGFLVYYLSYVSELTGSERTIYFGAVPAIGYAASAVVGFFWIREFSEKKLNPTRYAQKGLFLAAITRPIIIFSSTRPEMFVLAFAFRVVLTSPRPYWDTAVRGWIIDEDCQKNNGVRREGVILGFRATLRVIGLIIIQLVTIGMSAAGIDNTLPDGCPQKQSGVLYIRLIVGVLLPFCQILQLLLIEWFPIKGERLEQILAKQRETVLENMIEAEISPGLN